jgi:hypothetical protein
MSGKVKKKEKILFTFNSEHTYFFSTYAWDDRGALLNTIAHTPGTSVRAFNDDEVHEAGNGEPPYIPNARQEEFWYFLTREIGWDDYYAWRICMKLWYKANHADDPDYKDDFTIEEYFVNEALSLDDLTEEERQKGMHLLADYVAHIPRWTLKGHAPGE